MDTSDLLRPSPCPDAEPATLAVAGMHAIFQAMACGVVVQDHRGRIVECNPAAEHLLGLQRSQLMGTTSIDPRWRALDGNGHDLPGDRHPAMHTLRTGEPVSQFEMGVCLPSGERRWITVNTRPLAVSGRTWAVATFEEATARRNLAHTLSERWQRLSATLAGTGTWELHIATGALRPNPRWAEIAGWHLAELAEAEPLSLDTWMDLLHPEDRAVCRDKLQAHCAGTLEVFECEARVRHRDGSWRWVRDHGRIAGQARTVEADWVFGTREDITTRKQAELAAQHALSMLKGLFELMPVGISLVDTGTGRAADINDALCRLVGHSREELMQMDLSQLTPPELRARRAELFRIALETGHSDPCESVLLHRSGRPVPVLRSGARVDSPDGRPHVWSVVQDISALKTLEQQLRAAATQDRLTGLPNRAALTQQLEALAGHARTDPAFCFAVLFLDFDRFKLVNDTLGHTAGDELLRQIAERLQALLADPQFSQPGWTAGRLGGDEFVLLAPGLATPEAAQQLARTLCERLAAPYPLHGREIHSSASVGVALSRGVRTEAEALMREADTAMYAAKHAGRGSLRLFDDAMHAQLTRSVMIENALRQAHLRGEMQVVYQPIVDLVSGRLSSVEALLRWQHPELGQVSPAEFIPVAEECGAIIELGDWVLRRACEQGAAWQRRDPRHGPVTVSVNLSRLQLTLGDALVHAVRSALADTGLPATALQLEITEREVTKQATGTRGLMQTLHGLGVKLAMDDFGTGASSLGFLRDYPFDAIKIDKSFVTDLCSDPNVLAVAHATIQLVENLGMVSVAEGIEDPAELATLQSLGCRLGQGYLFGRPVPAEVLMQGLRGGGGVSG